MAAAGDRETFERLVLEHLTIALKFAVKLTGDADRAEELVQEAMLRASRGWHTFRGDSQFKTWLFRIVINVFRDRIAAPPAPEELPEHLPDEQQAEPTAVAIAGELGNIIAQHVTALPPRQREVLVLSAYEALPVREIAVVLGISEANVHATLHLARSRLRKQLAHYLAETKL